MGCCLGSREADIDFNGEVNFDHFRIIRAIGRGSFGKVCIVEKIDTNEQYAMKYVNKHHCLQMKCGHNTLREQKILASLDGECPFIVNLWFSFQDAEDLFFVVDYMAGGDLRFHLQSGPFDADRTRFYISEIALALRYLHSNDIIHRDIKPDNLLLDAKGHIHLTDFNVAHMKDSDGDKKPRSVAGTRPYMAPEVLLASKGSGYTAAVDWWSLGVTMYECLTLRQPFKISRDASSRSIVDYFRNVSVSFPSNLSVECIKATKAFLRVTVAKRVQTVDALKALDFFSGVDFDGLWSGNVAPPFVPPANHINCDPMHELEEMIVESQPLHKKRHRLKKQASQQGIEPQEKSKDLLTLEKYFFVFNRDKGGIIMKDAETDAGIVTDDGHGDLDVGQSSALTAEETNSEVALLFSRQNSTAQGCPNKQEGEGSSTSDQQTSHSGNSHSGEPHEAPLLEVVSENVDGDSTCAKPDDVDEAHLLSSPVNPVSVALPDGSQSQDCLGGMKNTHSVDAAGLDGLHSMETVGMDRVHSAAAVSADETKQALVESPSNAGAAGSSDLSMKKDSSVSGDNRESVEMAGVESPHSAGAVDVSDSKPLLVVSPDIAAALEDSHLPKKDQDRSGSVESACSAKEDTQPADSDESPKEGINAESSARREAVEKMITSSGNCDV